MKNIYIHGSFMYDNFGDYLLFATVVDALSSMDERINYYSANISDFYNKFIKYISLPQSKAIKRADMAVFAGGGYFGEPNRHKVYWNCRMLKKHAMPAIKLIHMRKPYCLLGVGVGPLTFGVSREIVKYIFSHADYVSVRDIESKEYLEQYGVTREINVAPDWIMGTNISDLIKDGHTSIEERYKNKFLIHFASKNKGAGSPISMMIDDIREIVRDCKIEFLIITDQADNKQIERAKLLKERLTECNIDLYEYHDPYELCYLISTSRGVVTDKLHVGIVASRLGKPAFSVAYHNKTIRFYRQIRRDEFCIPIEKMKPGVIKNWILNHMNDPLEYQDVLERAKENKNILKTFISKYL